MKNLLTTLTFILLFTSAIFAQVGNVSKSTKRMNNYLTELEKIGFSGTVLVELNGKQVISKGYGFSDQSTLRRNDPSTIFDIGSITKQFTAAAILKLEMQGKLSTDDRLSIYFDNIPKDKEIIAIHDLLRHQSGLISNVGPDYEAITKEAFLDKVFSSTLRFEVGTSFSYSNIGYSILAMIIEKVSGQAYETYLYENLWKPSQMEMTGYSRPSFDKTKIAIGYDNDNNIWGKPTDMEWDKTAPYWHLTGNGGILSTTDDLYKWHVGLMGEKILSSAAKNKMYHPKIRTEENYTSIYGYGWDIFQTDRNTKRVWHNGSNNIFYADFMRYIDEDVTLIMLSNKSHSNFHELNDELSKIIFDKKYKPVIPIADNEANRKLSHQVIETILSNGLEAGKNDYQKRPAKTDILEYLFNNKGYELLAQNHIDKAVEIFTMNTLAFPKSANAFDSLGEAFMNKGEKPAAIKNYEKSLELNPNNGHAKDMLEELRKSE